MNKGLFVTFEGIDGCGKSTQIQKLYQKLLEIGIPISVTREPGGTELSEKIRALLLSNDSSCMISECELLLFLASRAQLVGERIKPAITEGGIVLADRFQEATFAYQGYGRRMDLDTIYSLNEFATAGIKPGITFIFDIPVEESLKRLRGTEKDRMENEAVEFFERVRKGYLQAQERDPKGIHILDGTLSRTTLHALVYNTVKRALFKNSTGDLEL